MPPIEYARDSSESVVAEAIYRSTLDEKKKQEYIRAIPQLSTEELQTAVWLIKSGDFSRVIEAFDILMFLNTLEGRLQGLDDALMRLERTGSHKLQEFHSQDEQTLDPGQILHWLD